jgi:hypothetical protein
MAPPSSAVVLELVEDAPPLLKSGSGLPPPQASDTPRVTVKMRVRAPQGALGWKTGMVSVSGDAQA